MQVLSIFEKMFKITLSLFLFFFVSRSVSSLKCMITDDKKCPDKKMYNLRPCLNSHYTSQECASPNACLKGVYYPGGSNTPGTGLYLLGCGNSSFDHCYRDLFDPILGKNGAGFINTCDNCTNADNCNLNLKLRFKDVKRHKNSTDPPSAAPKKKSGGSRSYRITMMLQASIFVHILPLFFTFF